MKDLKVYVPSIRFIVMSLIVFVVVAMIMRALPNTGWANKVRYYLGYSSGNGSVAA